LEKQIVVTLDAKQVNQPWPQIGLIKATKKGAGTKLGTGFIVKSKYVITALHTVSGAEQIIFIQQDEPTVAGIEKEFPEYDLAILSLSKPPNKLQSLKLGNVPIEELPLLFKTCGYQAIGGVKIYHGFGSIISQHSETKLQLDTQSIHPTMSGCPLAINGKGGWRVVAIASKKHDPSTVSEITNIAIGCLFPESDITNYCDGFLKYQKVECIEDTVKAIDNVYMPRANKLLLISIGLAGGIALITVCLLGAFKIIDPISSLYFILIFVIAIMASAYKILQVDKKSYSLSIIKNGLKNSDVDSPLPQKLIEFWPYFKKKY
jgi:hypothetical protein